MRMADSPWPLIGFHSRWPISPPVTGPTTSRAALGFHLTTFLKDLRVYLMILESNRTSTASSI